jgi:hypothetical protein
MGDPKQENIIGSLGVVGVKREILCHRLKRQGLRHLTIDTEP